MRTDDRLKIVLTKGCREMRVDLRIVIGMVEMLKIETREAPVDKSPRAGQ